MIPSIAVGINKREGLYYPCYPLPHKCLKSIRARAEENKTLAWCSAEEAHSYIDKIAKDGGFVEIFGIYESRCVADAVRYALGKGLAVRVPKDCVFPAKGKNPTLEESVKESVRKYQPSKRLISAEHGGYHHFFLGESL